MPTRLSARPVTSICSMSSRWAGAAGASSSDSPMSAGEAAYRRMGGDRCATRGGVVLSFVEVKGMVSAEGRLQIGSQAVRVAAIAVDPFLSPLPSRLVQRFQEGEMRVELAAMGELVHQRFVLYEEYP